MRFSIFASLAAVVATVCAIPTIQIKGSKFFTSEGKQFFVKGIAYQLIDKDPLIDAAQCKRDSSLMKELGTNAIRVYHVDPTGDHRSCMQTFSDAGIYMFIDLDDFPSQINESSPAWTQRQHDMFAAVMDEFQRYDNVAGFFVGNEVLTMGNTSTAAPYVKAAARDMKAYRDSKGYRNIPIGYSAADIADLRPNLQNYLACGTNASEALDFFSLNAYEWCGQSNYDLSGYDDLTKNITAYNIPIFFSETGCNKPEPRTFEDQTAIFGDDMTPYWSGAIVYEWIQEANNYGLISYGPTAAPTATDAGVVGGYTRSGTPTPISPDFDNLSNQWKTLSPSGISANDYNPSNTAPACPAFTSKLWEVNGNVALPTIGQTFNAEVSQSIAAGTAAAANPTGASASASQSGASASATATGMASPGKHVAGMGAGLGGVLLGFLVWL